MEIDILLRVATLCAGLFTGAALYVSLVEHPARLRSGSAAAVAEFRPSYHRAAILQSILAVVCFVTAIAAWLRTHDVSILIAALLVLAVVPFTLIVIMPTNRRLFDPALDPYSPEVMLLLGRWGRLHAVRTLLGTAAFLLLLQQLACA